MGGVGMNRMLRLVYFANFALLEKGMQDVFGYLYAPPSSLAATSYPILLCLNDRLGIRVA